MKIQKTITFQPFGRRTQLVSGMSLLDAAHDCGVDITYVCGGVGVYDSCRVRLISSGYRHNQADHVAMLLASVFEYQNQVMDKSNTKNIIALDIGTNTEISLVYPQGHLCCSCASGPAFEGAHILFGMRAAAGAIERVQISDDIIRLKTINNNPPVGICGSDILDAISEMRAANIIELSDQKAFSTIFSESIFL